MNKFKKFMLHNVIIMGVLLYCGTPLVLIVVLPLLIGCIVNSGELCYLLIVTGMVLSLSLIPVLNKIAYKYIIGEY